MQNYLYKLLIHREEPRAAQWPTGLRDPLPSLRDPLPSLHDPLPSLHDPLPLPPSAPLLVQCHLGHSWFASCMLGRHASGHEPFYFTSGIVFLWLQLPSPLPLLRETCPGSPLYFLSPFSSLIALIFTFKRWLQLPYCMNPSVAF